MQINGQTFHGYDFFIPSTMYLCIKGRMKTRTIVLRSHFYAYPNQRQTGPKIVESFNILNLFCQNPFVPVAQSVEC